MKNVSLVLRRALLMIALASPLGLFAQGREVVNLNFDWYFHLGDLDAVPTALPAAARTNPMEPPNEFRFVACVSFFITSPYLLLHFYFQSL